MKLTSTMLKNGLIDTDQAFNEFFQTIRPSLKLWDYFVNWDKVFRNTKQIEIQLNLWNYLIGKEDFDNEFKSLLKQHPEIVSAIPSLVVRDGASRQDFSIIEDVTNLTKSESFFDFSIPALTSSEIDNALRFIKKSGIIKLFGKDGVKNLVDYVLGVEAGLDSNARKNRSGTSMETVVEAYLAQFAKENKLSYLTQANPNKIKDKWGFNVPVDKASRSYDFAISDGKELVILEVNFYGGGGSKLKATAGEYKGLHDLLNIPKTKFVWITDGAGWETAKKPLESAFEHIDYVWNLNWLSKGFLVDLI
jgi:type II restriction enzyme